MLRFNEDALRILRALRFSSTLDFSIDPATAQAAHDCRALLKHVSVERIAVEFNKLLCGHGVERVLTEYIDIIGVFIPEMLPNVGFEQKNSHHIYDVYTHICKAVAAALPELPLRLAAWFHDIGKCEVFSCGEDGVGHFYGHEAVSAEIAVRVMERLRYERALTELLRELIVYHDTPIMTDRKNIKRWLNRLSAPVLQQLLWVKRADTLAKSPEFLYRLDEFAAIEAEIESILSEEECFSLKDLAVNGRDLIALGFPCGKKIGEVLNLLLDSVINEELPNEREALLQKARGYLL